MVKGIITAWGFLMHVTLFMQHWTYGNALGPSADRMASNAQIFRKWEKTTLRNFQYVFCHTLKGHGNKPFFCINRFGISSSRSDFDFKFADICSLKSIPASVIAGSRQDCLFKFRKSCQILKKFEQRHPVSPLCGVANSPYHRCGESSTPRLTADMRHLREIV